MNLLTDIKARKKKEDELKRAKVGRYDKKKYACGCVLRVVYTALAAIGAYMLFVFSLMGTGTAIYTYLYSISGQGTPADLMVAGGGTLFIVFWSCVISFFLIRLIYRKFKESWTKTDEYFKKIP